MAQVAALLAAGCDQGATSVDAPTDVTVPSGYTQEVLSDALTGPTQVIRGADGRLWVAELNGGEGDATGRVIALAEDGTVGDVLLDGLDKPTGITLAGDGLWVMQQDALWRASLQDDLPGELEPVLTDLPTNGRSETSLSTMPDGRVLFGVTGAERAVEDSGYLAVLDPGSGEPVVIATGLKNAYAQVPTGNGIVATEIGDGTFDGGPPLDELVRLQEGDDAGWPRCTGDRDPSEDRGVTAADCEDTVTPLATFPARATPTGLAALDGDWLVALWSRGEVVRVPRDGGEPEVWADGLEGPQDLLVEDGVVHLTEHRAGRLLVFRPS